MSAHLIWVGPVACLALLLSPTVASHAIPSVDRILGTEQQEPQPPAHVIFNADTAPVETDTAGFHEALDQARRLHLDGNSREAVQLLEGTPGTADESGRNALREMMAFLLMATGEHERAFDSLQVLHLSRITIVEQKVEELMRLHEQERELAAQQASAQATTHIAQLERVTELNRILQVIIGGLAVLLAVLLFLLFWSKRSSTREPVPFPPPVPARSLVKKEAPAPSGPALEQNKKGPVAQDETAGHVERLSALVNGGSTVEAAVHLDVWKRFLRMQNALGQEQASLPDTIALLRQYLKLTSMRMPVKLRYSVDAHPELRDLKVTAPAAELLGTLHWIMPRLTGTPAPYTVVEFSRNTSVGSMNCFIRWNKTPERSGESVFPPAPAGVLKMKPLAESAGETGVSFEWPTGT